MKFTAQYYSMACASLTSVQYPAVLPQGTLRNEFVFLKMHKSGLALMCVTHPSQSFSHLMKLFIQSLHTELQTHP